MTLWSERQRQMLAAMGLRVWAPDPSVPAEPAAHEELPRPQPLAVDKQGVADRVGRHPSTAAPARAAVGVAPTPVAERPMPVAADGLAWSPLRAAVAGCRACPLHEGRTQTVFGSGHPQAHWMIVGEAPVAEEDAAGEPFVGAAGQLLDNMLAALGLSRAQSGEAAQRAYLLNAVRCRPPSGRSAQAADVQRCAPYLQQQIALVQPKIIIAMGRLAAQALLQADAPLGQLRGQVHRVGGLPLVVTYPPVYLLRSPVEKAKVWLDLCMAAACVTQPE